MRSPSAWSLAPTTTSRRAGGRDSRPTPGLRLALQYPARDRLVVVERPRHRHVRLDVGEAGARERAIRRHVERVGFTEESLDLEDVEVDRGGSPHTLRAVAGAA